MHCARSYGIILGKKKKKNSHDLCPQGASSMIEGEKKSINEKLQVKINDIKKKPGC